MGTGTAVVTGGRGFVGHHLAQQLVRQGRRVVIYDLPPNGADVPPPIEGVEYVDGDVRDADAVRLTVSDDVDVVFHLAAVVGVDRYMEDPSRVHDVNVIGTRNAVAAAARRGAKFVLASTSEVYGKNPQVPWHETSDTVVGSSERSRWCYAVSKLMAEHLVLDASRRHRVPSTIVRLFNVYGPYQRPDFVISRNLHLALTGQPLEVHDDGRQTRCFTYVDDAVEAIARAGDRGVADGVTINIGSDSETTILAAVRLLRSVLDAPHLEIRLVRRRAGDEYEDVPRRVPAVDRADRYLGWRAKTDLATGLAATVRWTRRSTR